MTTAPETATRIGLTCLVCSEETLGMFASTVSAVGRRDGWDAHFGAGLRIHIDDSIEWGAALLVSDRWLRDSNLYYTGEDIVEYYLPDEVGVLEEDNPEGKEGAEK